MFTDSQVSYRDSSKLLLHEQLPPFVWPLSYVCISSISQKIFFQTLGNHFVLYLFAKYLVQRDLAFKKPLFKKGS